MTYRLMFAVLLAFFLLSGVGLAEDNWKSLERAIRREYPGCWQVTVEQFSLTPYQGEYFALIMGRTNDASEHYAVWETVGGRWSFVFDYDLNGRFLGSPKELDELYGRYRLSPKMRLQLGHACQTGRLKAFPPYFKAAALSELERSLMEAARRHDPPGQPFVETCKFLKQNLAAGHGSIGVVYRWFVSVWRKRAGTWVLAFEYRPWALSDAQVKALYARHNLPYSLRPAVEHFDLEKDDVRCVDNNPRRIRNAGRP